MSDSPRGRAERAFHIALAASVLLHLVLLFAPLTSRKAPPRTVETRMTVRLAPPAPAPPKVEQPPVPRATRPPKRSPAPKPPPRMLTSEHGTDRVPVPAPEEPRTFSAAEKAEMDQFLQSLGPDKPTQPTLAERSVARAREMVRESARDAGRAVELDAAHGPIAIERIPDSPEIDPFSLEMYLDALVNKLNRTSSFVKREGRRAGVRHAAAQLRLNPDGSVHSFEVLNAADQQSELAYIAALVNFAAPYPRFPPDIVKSAKTMAILICINPATESGSIGFTRKTDGRRC
jgi:hypothetical protein